MRVRAHVTPSSVTAILLHCLPGPGLFSCQVVSDTKTRWEKSFVNVSWFTLTLRAAADPQHPPQGFGGYSIHFGGM